LLGGHAAYGKAAQCLLRAKKEEKELSDKIDQEDQEANNIDDREDTKHVWDKRIADNTRKSKTPFM